MIKVILLGSGNVAFHLFQAFTQASGVKVVQVYCRTFSTYFPSKIQTSNFAEILNADVYITCVSDNAIATISNLLPFENRLVVHTSGSTNFNMLHAKNRRGVLYPLQTFSKNKVINFSTVPLCIETENISDYEILEKLACSISNTVVKIDSNQRKALHIAAVFVCNFVNHLYEIGNEICNENNIPFTLLHPLIEETAVKIKKLSPNEAQTGPAVRNDTNTIEKHIDFLANENHQEIYKILTKSIQNVQKL